MKLHYNQFSTYSLINKAIKTTSSTSTTISSHLVCRYMASNALPIYPYQTFFILLKSKAKANGSFHARELNTLQKHEDHISFQFTYLFYHVKPIAINPFEMSCENYNIYFLKKISSQNNQLAIDITTNIVMALFQAP